jgi:hypothetical protein
MTEKNKELNYELMQDFTEPYKNNEKIHLLNYFISVAIFSLSAFYIKCLTIYYGPTFSSQLFTAMRSLGTMLIESETYL